MNAAPSIAKLINAAPTTHISVAPPYQSILNIPSPIRESEDYSSPSTNPTKSSRSPCNSQFNDSDLPTSSHVKVSMTTPAYTSRDEFPSIAKASTPSKFTRIKRPQLKQAQVPVSTPEVSNAQHSAGPTTKKKRLHQPRKYKCELCSSMLDTLSNLKRHTGSKKCRALETAHQRVKCSGNQSPSSESDDYNEDRKSVV